MMSSSSNKVAIEPATTKHLPSAGIERLKADYRMYGSLLLTLGMCAAYGSFADIVSLSGNPTEKSGLGLATLIAAVLQAFFGITCMATGFMAVVMDKGSKTLTTIATVSIQLAWAPFIVGLATIVTGILAGSDNPFIPPVFNPTTPQINFVGAMSLFGLCSYAIGYIGSLGFMAFSMHAIQAGKPHDRSGLYFRGRAKTYNALLMLAGFTQLAIGSMIICKYGNGPLAEPIFAVVYPVIFFPEISVTVGLLQILVGATGIARSLRRSQSQGNNSWFQALCLFMYVCMVSMQILVQIAYAPGGTAAAAAPTLGCVYFGISFMPAFLDWKMNNVPENLADLEGYYGEVADEKQLKLEAALEMEEIINNSVNVNGDNNV